MSTQIDRDHVRLDLDMGEVVVDLVLGPHPYIWIGAPDNKTCLGTCDTAELRKFRDAITKALRDG